VLLSRSDVMVLVSTVIRHVCHTGWQPQPWSVVALIGLCLEHDLTGLAKALRGILDHVVRAEVSRN
jgi:hypothetical protein